MKPARTWVVASHNPGKIKEIEALLAPYGVKPVGAAALGLPEPEETEDTFAGNAALKARAAAQASGLPALADDSGFCVAALGGAPGVHSARWGGAGRDFTAAMRTLWAKVQETGSPDRSARFVCALALAHPGGACAVYEGVVEGELVWPPRGGRGFGYDPVFVPHGHAETFAEMDPALKQAISHRKRAFEKLIAAELAG
ncbi:MAG: RdgB/HAM1 family non-canonical purine NTP pyrophosphatase [Maricaulaceae bacterium]|nr:RdgB/HAM1 family non-canonical purine NTP pyrophosphatase [Maricaulaceae bacterium]